jgi:hypothetical protein
MNKARTPLLLALTAVVSLSLSCSRAPQENGPSTSAGSSNADANTASPNPTSVATETKDQQKTDSDPSAGGFVGRDIDINSGDLRGVRAVAAGPPPYVIIESKLSKELRRLGIPIPAERQWKVAGRMSAGGMDVYYQYESLPAVIQRLMATLDDADAPDEERRDVLWRFMTSLRSDKPSAAAGQAHMLWDEVSKRHGLDKQRPSPSGVTKQPQP